MSNHKICVVKLKSNAALANIRPVKPQNKTWKALTITNDQSLKFISVKANDQANIFTAVGTPITNVAHEKLIRVISAILTVNIWWAHTKNPTNPIEK